MVGHGKPAHGWLPRFVVEELAAHLAGPIDPEAFVFTAPQGGPLVVTGFRDRLWRPATATVVTATRLDMALRAC